MRNVHIKLVPNTTWPMLISNRILGYRQRTPLAGLNEPWACPWYLEYPPFPCLIAKVFHWLLNLWSRQEKKRKYQLDICFFPVHHYTTHSYIMSRGGRGGGFGRGGGGGGPQSGAMQLVSFDLLKDLGSGNLFNVNTALFPVCVSW